MRRKVRDPIIGERIRIRRELAGMSIRRAAAATQALPDPRRHISHSTWSRMERGETGSDNRFSLASIAEVLRCPVSELLGHKVGPADRDERARADAVHAAVQAMLDCDLELPPQAPAPPIALVEREVELVYSLRRDCNYLGAAIRIAAVAPGLHALALTGSADDARRATRWLVTVADAAAFTARYSGEAPAAALIAERGRQAAERLDDPIMLGFAAFTRAHAALACGCYQRGRLIAERAADAVRPHMGADAGAEVYGQLVLTGAFAAYALGERETALDRVAEAAAIAETTGESPALNLCFGPENTKFWLVSMHADGDPGDAVEVANRTNPAAVPSTSRQTAYRTDLARALAHLGRDREALRMLVAAERLAPQRVRADRLAAETARSLLERARRDATGRELRGLCERMGVDA